MQSAGVLFSSTLLYLPTEQEEVNGHRELLLGPDLDHHYPSPPFLSFFANYLYVPGRAKVGNGGRQVGHCGFRHGDVLPAASDCGRGGIGAINHGLPYSLPPSDLSPPKPKKAFDRKKTGEGQILGKRRRRSRR